MTRPDSKTYWTLWDCAHTQVRKDTLGVRMEKIIRIFVFVRFAMFTVCEDLKGGNEFSFEI